MQKNENCKAMSGTINSKLTKLKLKTLTFLKIYIDSNSGPGSKFVYLSY